MIFRRLVFLTLIALLYGCSGAEGDPGFTSTPAQMTAGPTPTQEAIQTQPISDINDFAFPDDIDPGRRYMFYVHGRIIEEQGIPAVSPVFGEYKYLEILETLEGHGFVVISEQRGKDANAIEYAKRVRDQVRDLLRAGVPADHITVVGASKGAYITIYVSHFLGNKDINYVLLAICHPEVVEDFKQAQVILYGKVLSIYDAVDEYAGSCQGLFARSEGRGIARYVEIVLEVGTGHGVLYQPMEEWLLPTVRWAMGEGP